MFEQVKNSIRKDSNADKARGVRRVDIEGTLKLEGLQI